MSANSLPAPSAIRSLPASTARLLSSSQALTSPTSLIKELLDNALDARATSITLDVSPNLIDTIQLRDNGFGIPADDRPLVATRHATSKIRGYADIAELGGASLGFRGEGLASIKTVCESLVITTRTEGEQMGWSWEVGKEGEGKSVSAMVGTVVKVTGFLKGLPVRRENAIHNIATHLKKLKHLLAGYYLSRPKVRIALNILQGKAGSVGAKPGKGNSVYPPSKTVLQAVRNVVGKDAAGACEWISTLGGNGQDETVSFEACLPKPSASENAFKSPLCAHYVFVDSRAVNPTRGTLKNLVSLCKTYQKNAAKKTIALPFLFLNVLCEPKSYDANIEPAKDDVLFVDAESILKAWEEVLKGLYGELNEPVGREQPTAPHPTGSTRAFDVLLARKKVIESEEAADSGEPKEKVTTHETGSDKEVPQTPERAAHSSGWRPINENEGFARDHSAMPPEEPRDRVAESRVEPAGASAEDTSGEENVTRAPKSQPVNNGGSRDNMQKNTETPRKAGTETRSSVPSYRINEDELPPPPVDPDEEEAELRALNEADIEAEHEIVRKSASLSNPWTAAKMGYTPSYHTLYSTSTTPNSNRAKTLSPVKTTIVPPPQYATLSPTGKRPPLPSPTLSSPTRMPLQKRQRVLEDAVPVGAMDRFVTRIPRSPAGPPPLAQPSFVTAKHVHQDPDDPIDDIEEDRPPPRRRRIHKDSDSDSDTPMMPYDPTSPAPPRRRQQNRQNPSANRFHAATAALSKGKQRAVSPSLSPLPPQDQFSRPGTSSLSTLPVDARPLAEEQTLHLVQRVEVCWGKLDNLRRLMRAAGETYGLKPANDGFWMLEEVDVEDAGELVQRWVGKTYGLEEQLGRWEVGEAEEGWEIMRLVEA